VLVSVGGLLVIGGIVALVIVMMQPKPQPVPVGNESNVANEATKADGDSNVVYREGASAILDSIDAAVDHWSAAADFGADGKFDESTAELNDGLKDVKDAEAQLADLDPTADTAVLHDLLTEAVAKARLAMEKGIEGNETDNIDAIDESGQAIEDLGALLEDIANEVDGPSTPDQVQDTEGEQPSETEPVVEVPTVTAVKLVADYDANQLSADKKYKDKVYKITGTIDDFGSELLGNPYVSLVGDGYFNTVRCGFGDDQADAISKLSKGQQVTFQGTIYGDLIGSVSVNDCSIVK